MIKNIAIQVEKIKEELNNLSKLIIKNNGDAEYFYLEEEREGQSNLFTNDINRIASSINMLEFNDELESNETKHFYGVAAINNEIASKIHSINDLKATLKENYLAAGFRKNPSKRRELLELISFKRLNARQLYRKIPIIDEKTRLVSFSMCNTKSIKPITWSQAFSKISILPSSSNTDQDTQYLNNNSQKDFAIVQNNPPHMRVNYQDEKKKKYQIKSSLPIFILTEDNTLPIISKPFERDYKQHIRENQYLSTDVVLHSIKAFEYTNTRSDKWINTRV